MVVKTNCGFGQIFRFFAPGFLSQSGSVAVYL